MAMTEQRSNLDPEEFFRTNDMAMVTFLKLHGHQVQEVKWENEVCYWFFHRNDALLDLVDMFHDGTARVEPREYNRTFNQTKREFYDSKSHPTPV